MPRSSVGQSRSSHLEDGRIARNRSSRGKGPRHLVLLYPHCHQRTFCILRINKTERRSCEAEDAWRLLNALILRTPGYSERTSPSTLTARRERYGSVVLELEVILKLVLISRVQPIAILDQQGISAELYLRPYWANNRGGTCVVVW